MVETFSGTTLTYAVFAQKEGQKLLLNIEPIVHNHSLEAKFRFAVVFTGESEDFELGVFSVVKNKVFKDVHGNTFAGRALNKFRLKLADTDGTLSHVRATNFISANYWNYIAHWISDLAEKAGFSVVDKAPDSFDVALYGPTVFAEVIEFDFPMDLPKPESLDHTPAPFISEEDFDDSEDIAF
jgi:hypothetical protein